MAFTEFYCQNGGSNLNAGSTTNNTAAYTTTNGNWSTTTNVFTPTDGSTPASFISVGDFVSIYIDGATVGVCVARVTAVAAGVNGGITVSATARAGTAPTTSATGRSLKAGGAWQGPNGASGFPFTLSTIGSNQNASANKVRINMKNDQTYALTAVTSWGTAGLAYIVQGYSSTLGDGGKATWDGGTSTGQLIASVGTSGVVVMDMIFQTSITTGNTHLITMNNLGYFIRCVFHGARNAGILATTTGALIECEAYDCNKANLASIGAFHNLGQCNMIRCYAHDNIGSNASGFLVNAGNASLINCISESNGQYGIWITAASVNGMIHIINCDIYNNTSDGIHFESTSVASVWIENNNFLKNGGKAINNLSNVVAGWGFNNGYGSGTQANGSADTLNNIQLSGTVTYASDVTPWNAPTTGDFSITLAAAKSAGRGAFTETDGTNTGTVGYPDIGSAQAAAGSGGGPTSYSFG